jgi:hypothetical protein
MKWVTIIILLFGLTACTNHSDKKVVDKKSKMIRTDSSYNESNEINETDVQQSYEELHNCNLDEFIEDKEIPKLAKDIYLDKDWSLSNDNEALALLDSLTAKNKESRPFYFKVVTKTHKKSDGYFSEGLGAAGKQYVENNTKEFVSNFDNQGCFTANDMTIWADILILEFSISGDGEYDKPIIDDYIKKLKSNCKDCSTAQKENLNKFGLTLQNKWAKFLKNTNE